MIILTLTILSLSYYYYLFIIFKNVAHNLANSQSTEENNSVG